MLAWIRIAALSLVVAAAAGGVARAQDEPSEEQRAAAREAFQAGLAAARDGDWQTALAQFQRAYDTVPAPGVLINLAGAQRQLGQLAAAADTYRRFLREATEGSAARHRETAQRELAEIEARLGHIEVQASSLAEGDEVRVDDRAVPASELHAVEVDAGRHAVTVVRDGQTVASAEAEVGVGGQASVTLDVPPRVATPEEAANSVVVPAPVTPPPGGTEPEEESGGVLSSPVFWIVVGAVVVGGAVTGIVLATSGTEDPYVGSFGQGHVEVP